MKVPQVVHIMSKYVDELAEFCGNYHFLNRIYLQQNLKTLLLERGIVIL